MATFLVQRCVLAVLLCCLFSSIAQFVCADESDVALDETQRAAIKVFVDASKKVREDKYGNVHFVMIQSKEARGAKKNTRAVTEIKYWSRDNRHFRMDTKTIKSSDPTKVGGRTRIVAAPDGYIYLAAETAKAPLTIRGWGSFEEGWDSLAGNFCVQGAARSSGIGRADVQFGKLVVDDLEDEAAKEIASRKTILGVNLSNGGSHVELKSRWASNPYSTESKMLCDITNGVVLRYESKNFTDGAYTFSHTSDKEYEFDRFGCIPSRHREKDVNSSGGTSSVDYKTQLVSWEPVPTGLFSLEAQGLGSVRPGSVWGRRSLTLLVGLVLFGIYLGVKWVRNRGIE